MKAFDEIILIWCIVNFPFLFLFHNAGAITLWMILFFSGLFIMFIPGLIKAHRIDEMRKA